MELLIAHASSRYFWRSVYSVSRAPQQPGLLPNAMTCCASSKLAGAILPSWAAKHQPLHVISSDKRNRLKTKSIEVHVWSKPFPDGSFYDLGHGVYVSSPAFEFLTMAAKTSIWDTIAFGFELCGLYSFDPELERGFRTRSTPLVTKLQLEQFLTGASGCRGHRQAVRALRYVVERSASPMESTCAMLMCLPYSLGGYGLPMPLMNHRIQLSEAARIIAKRAYCVADVCYPEAKLDLEYHGRFDHDAPDAFDSDRARVNALVEMDYEVIELTRAQIHDLFQFEAIMKHVAKQTEKRIRTAGLGPTPARIEARRFLFAWNKSSGEPSFSAAESAVENASTQRGGSRPSKLD